MTDVLPPSTIQDLITGLNQLIRAEIPLDKKAQIIVEYFKSYKNNDWEKYAFWDDFRYTRNLIEEIDGCYSLILMCWPEGSASRIHDHPNADCIMAYRHLIKVQPCEETTATKGDVLHMNDSMGVHRVENASSSERAATLHFYFPCIHECLIFAEDTGKSTKKKVKRVRPGIKPKKSDKELTKEELAVRERRRKRNKEAAARKRREFKENVAKYEAQIKNLEADNNNIVNELAEMKEQIRKMNAALQNHSCAEHQQFFPAETSFYGGLTEAFEENQAPDDQKQPATPEKMAVPMSIFDEFGIFVDDLCSKEHVAPANNGSQQKSYSDIGEILGFDVASKMPAMQANPPSYEETQQMFFSHPCVNEMSAMELENLFA
ncbi:Oidioi.mRNA.OKI2018_I69.chr1.g3323.t1.cds [Oikopleura dioica]|uniref:Cysteine dioxygenase type 1 n=1 Tax=Oikopleura dioica TaxID=34765 RepID=A0ABN7SZ79_OIKDI|nr:Oidioi.mRNA.OKI2018_I69.chr1.g3323.t1.cds [Oikopleura dioica]